MNINKPLDNRIFENGLIFTLHSPNVNWFFNQHKVHFFLNNKQYLKK